MLTLFLLIGLSLNKQRNIIFDITLAFIIILFIKKLPIDILGINLLKWHLPFFLIGFILSKYKEYFSKYFKLTKEVSIILFPILLTQFNFFTHPDFLNSTILISLYKYLIAFCGIAIMYIISISIKSNFIKEKLSYLGNNSIDIYAIHFTFVNIVGTGYVSGMKFGISFLTVLLSTIISIIFSLLISNFVIKQSEVLKFLLLGR